MANKSKIALGNLENVESAKQQGLINEFDILLLDGDTNKPKIGWIDANGNTILVTDEKADLTEVENGLAEVNAEVDALTESMNNHVTEANAAFEATNAEVAKKADEASVAVSYERVKFEIADTPIGTLVDYKESEIRVMCPANTVWTKQAVGVGGDANTHYMTLKTYCSYDNAVGYKEVLSGNADPEILKDLKEDAYGRRYQPTWLGLAKYDEASDAWSYYGALSSEDRYIGWDYAIEWYDENDVLIARDSVRINLSNEECHGNVKPSYVNEVLKEMKEYCDTAVSNAAGKIEVVEF